MSLANDIKEMKSQLVLAQDELGKLRAIAEDMKAKCLALEQEKDELAKAIEAEKADKAAKEAEAKALIEKSEADAKAKAQELETAKAQMAMIPLADAVEGTKAISSGDAGSAEVIDHKAKMEALPSLNERMAYYSQYRKEIDAAYKSR